MADKNYFLTKGVSTYVNPLLEDGQLIHALNVVSYPYGAKSKRTGYSSFLGTPDTSEVKSLFSFPNINNNSDSFNLYRASGSIVYHSLQGTGAWTVSGNGTITNGNHFGCAILSNTLIGGDGSGSTRHTTNGTSFTNTTLAPVGEFFEEFQRRVYIAGTDQTLFYSTTNDGTNWNTSGTSDSSSLTIPGAGKLQKIFKSSDKLVNTKSSGIMQKWDGYTLIDMATTYGPSSPYSVANTEGYRFFINQIGHYGYGGGVPQLLSNAVQNIFYNNENTGIAGTAFSTIPAECHIYDYLASIGTITDNFTSRTISNAILKYDYQKNEYLFWNFANKPTAFHSYKDGSQKLIFGDASGQVYLMDNSTTDNGSAIQAEMVQFFHFDVPHLKKAWRWLRLFFNPGCEAKVQIACSDSFDYESLIFQEVGDCSKGFCEFRFPPGSQSNFLFLRIYESSKNSRFTYYGCQISADIEPVI